MEGKEFGDVLKDPRYSGKLKKYSKKDKLALKSLFVNIEEETAFKDKRGRPWSKKPIRYVKQLAEKGEFDNDSTTEESLSSDSESSSGNVAIAEKLTDLQDADWQALVEDAKETTKITRRLALLHFDWDNVNAEAIFLALESFLLPGGCLEKVTIYPSEYGMRRMTEEQTRGPSEIWQKFSDEDKPQNDEDSDITDIPGDLDADEKKAWKQTSVGLRSRLRRYQLARLKYFYAIAEFDTVESAAAVYEACDGVEYGSTGVRFDLRFVEDNEQFSVPPEWAHVVSECSEVNKAKYVPRSFETPALHSTRITLTWDKTPSARTEWLREQFIDTADPKYTLGERKAELEEYLAMSSSGQSTAAPSDADEPGPASTVPRIHKHRPPRVAPEVLRASLLTELGAANSGRADSCDEDDEEVEEVVDLNEGLSQNSDGDEEEYDLAARDEETESVVQGRRPRGRKRGVKRRRLPEAEDSSADDSDDELDFADMENRMSDDSDAEERGRVGISRNKNKLRQEVADETSDIAKRKRTKRINQRKKMLLKRKKQENSREKLKTLWTDENGETDDRFDEFLSNPEFGVSQLHRNYKDTAEFLIFMRRRRAPSRLNPAVGAINKDD